MLLLLNRILSLSLCERSESTGKRDWTRPSSKKNRPSFFFSREVKNRKKKEKGTTATGQKQKLPAANEGRTLE